MFQNRVPRASSIPRWKPDFENGWHGNPAARTSCGERRIRSSVSATMSPRAGHPPVALVHGRRVGILLDGVDALATEGAESGVETADPGEQVDERERRTRARSSCTNLDQIRQRPSGPSESLVS